MDCRLAVGDNTSRWRDVPEKSVVREVLWNKGVLPGDGAGNMNAVGFDRKSRIKSSAPLQFGATMLRVAQPCLCYTHVWVLSSCRGMWLWKCSFQYWTVEESEGVSHRLVHAREEGPA